MIKVIYRLSDKGNPKNKLDFATKEYCLNNALSVFGKDNVYVLADNCEKSTIEFLQRKKINYEQTQLGNGGTFLHAVLYAINNLNDEDFVYLLEDDYLHLPNSALILEEGLALGDYVTLYDHPDFYRTLLHGCVGGGEIYSDNPLYINKLLPCTLYASQHVHFRTTVSTCLTFACKVKILKEDFSLVKKMGRYKTPESFLLFMQLTQNHFGIVIKLLKSIFYIKTGRIKNLKLAFSIFFNILRHKKNRVLLSSVPAYSTHTEVNYLSPVRNWSKNEQFN